jgi:hypothetical protein
MTDAQMIELERQSNPFCLCGVPWRTALSGLVGIIRMGPTCPLPASYCMCDIDAVT